MIPVLLSLAVLVGASVWELWPVFVNAVRCHAMTRPAVRIYNQGDLYLERFYILGRKSNHEIPDEDVRLAWLPTLWVHHFVRPDADRELHNHPWWWAVSVVFAGAYLEEREGHFTGWVPGGPVVVKVWRSRRVRWLNIIIRRTWHRVAELDGDVWTLFMTGGKAGRWSFLVPARVIPWRQFVRDRENASQGSDPNTAR